MATRLRMAVLTHEFDDFTKDHYLLLRLCKEWEQAGVAVAIVRGTKRGSPPADLAFLHVDVTQVAEEYQQLAQTYPVVINGMATDISKGRVSKLILRDPSAYDGAVIVKTHNNFGGRPERTHAIRQGLMKKGEQESARWDEVRYLAHYPLYRSPREVPSGVWANPNLMVDRFLPEQDAEGQFVLRVWVFLGDRSLHYRCISREPIIKSTTTLRREPLPREQIPEELRERRAELGFDYGKFDYVMHDGKAVLIDANKTPGTPPEMHSGQEAPEVAERFSHLSRGLEHFTARVRSAS